MNDTAETVEMLKNIIEKIFYGKHGELMRYAFFGVLNVIVTWVSYAALVLIGIRPDVSNAASWVIGVAFAFFVNKWFVFESKGTGAAEVGKEAASFTLGRIITGIISIVGFPILYNIGLNQHLLGVDGFLAKIIVSAIEIILNYVFSKYMVFNKPVKRSK